MSKKVCATLLALLLILNCCTFGHFHLNAQKTDKKIADLTARLEKAETRIAATNTAIEEVKTQEETDKAATDASLVELEAGLASAVAAIDEVQTQVEIIKNGPKAAMLMSDVNTKAYEKMGEMPVFGNTRYLREQITSIVFEQSDIGKNDAAWDVSGEGTGTVSAWVDTEKGLHIGPAEGYAVSLPEDCKALFAGYTNVLEIDFGAAARIDYSIFPRSSGVNTGNARDMSWMFANCNKLTELDVSGFDTSNVITMTAMFCNCSSLISLDVSGFDTCNVTDISYMFYGCSELKTLDVSRFDTCMVTNMCSVFANCSKLTELDVSDFDTNNVTDMSWMFYGCSSLLTLDVSHFNTGNVTKMGCMFERCSSLTSLDVTHFNTSNVTDMSYMFYDCRKLENLDVSGFDMRKAIEKRCMLEGCKGVITEKSSANTLRNQ